MGTAFRRGFPPLLICQRHFPFPAVQADSDRLKGHLQQNGNDPARFEFIECVWEHTILLTNTVTLRFRLMPSCVPVLSIESRVFPVECQLDVT